MKKLFISFISAILLTCFVFLASSNAGTVQLPQTGQTKCYDTAGVEIACSGTGQDGEIRAGVPWPSPRFSVSGDCVTDNLTGLMWARNGNLAGYMSRYSAVDYANNLTLCGYSDWRLPNVNELEILVNADVSNIATWLNTQGFYNVQSDYYWSSTSRPDYTTVAWIVKFMDGDMDFSWNGHSWVFSYVLPVRSGQAGTVQLPQTGQKTSYMTGDDGDLEKGIAWPNPRFYDNGNGTVTDNLTGLMWLKNANCIATEYPSFDNDDYYGTVEDGRVTWEHALDFVKGINNGTYSQCGASYNDWHLPNRKELRSLIDHAKYILSLPTGHPFTNVQSDYYWSSTTHAGNTYNAWIVDMWVGSTDILFKGINPRYVWPVRSGQSGSFGNLDHFEFSSIPTPQSVGMPFNVTITAKDTNGNTEGNYTGWVTLSSSAGSISPMFVYLKNGTWSGNITFFEGGNNIQITASSDGAQSTSNQFSTSGAGFGRIYGVVKDNLDNVLSGATVRLSLTENGPDAYTPVQTDFAGDYTSDYIASGTYYIWAEYNGKSSDKKLTKFVPGGRPVTQDLTIEMYRSTDIPVILVPGIMGSTHYTMAGKKSWTAIYPYLTKSYEKQNELIFHNPSDKAGWEDLKTILKNKGLNPKTNIIDCPYDWRVSLNKAVEWYLKPCIEKAKNGDPNMKVNIIAHSMGGLLTRAYIQGSSYNNDILNFSMVGTPNKGASKAYYIWEGGDPKKADDLTDSGFTSGINFYWNTVKKLYEDTYELGDLSSNESRKIWDFIHQYLPTGRQLLPTYSFLDRNGTLNPITSADNINDFLNQLNTKSNRYDLMGIPPTTDKVNTRLYYSSSEPTITKIGVKDKSGFWELSDLYEDGVPSKDPTMNNEGDGTVPETSAKLPCNEGWAQCNYKSGEHFELIKKAAQNIVNDLYPASQNLISGLKASAMTNTASTTSASSNMYLSFRGRIQPYIIDPQGRSLGINYTNGVVENTIPDAGVNIDAGSGSLSIDNPLDGTYMVYLKGIYNENYSLSIGYMDTAATIEKNYRVFNHFNTTSFTFTVNSSSADKITVNHTPLPPTGFQADTIDTGNLTTQLTWDISTDPNVTGYNIYSKYDDEPYLAQIGTATTNSFDTGHSWAENSTIKTRLYAVSAVKADGTESFLSNMVENNDRDHDGLTDEEEVKVGTDVSNPDTDGDGLKDGEEYVHGTNPLLTDTDGDGFSDYAEVQAGSDPLDVNSFPCTDNDSDGYGNPGSTLCPNGSATDCNDNDPSINPGAVEVCDGVDNNCNGQIDEGLLNTYYRDADGDTYGNPNNTTQACTLPAGYVTNNLDCNDSNAAIKPGAVEICTDGIDNNCNNLIDSADPNCQSSGADLVIYSLTVPLSGIPGSTITVKDTTKNIGTGTAGASTTKFYWSTNSTWDAGDTLLGSRAIPSLAAGAKSPATGSASTSVTIPTGTCSGTFYIIARADADNLIAETNETNNTKYKSIKTGPDLIVSTLTAPATSGAGKTITVGDTTKNQGGCPAGASTTKLYFSNNSTWDAGDTYLGERPVPALAAGATDTGSTSVTIPAGTSTGTRYIIAKADANAVVTETSETNNKKSKSIKIGPDLIVSLITAPTSAVRGSTISVSDTTKNSGGGDAGASTTKLYLSTNTTWDAGDTYLGSRAVPMLSAGASSAGSTSVTIPSGIATGPYYIIALTDDGNVVVETNETNNKKTKAITINP